MAAPSCPETRACPEPPAASPAAGPALRGGLPLLALTAVLGLSACANANPGASEINDPLEPMNRKVHAFNKGADKVVVRPAAKVYGTVVPKPIRTGISNFAWNLGMPSAILNSLLEGDVQGAGKNSFRFLVNTTFGLGGVLDPATDMGLTEQEADFGETLHDWGLAEGPYVELPLLGPSTTRDALGKVVDYVTDPVNSAFQSPEKQYVTGTKGLSLVGERYTYMGTVDSLLYDSADSYAQARLLYLQNRRFELGSDTEVDTYDPYEDSDGQ